MTATINISDIIKSHPLGDKESYNLYLCRNDEYRNCYGYIDRYTDADEIARHVYLSMNNPDVLGVWVTLESDNGNKDIDIFKVQRGI